MSHLKVNLKRTVKQSDRKGYGDGGVGGGAGTVTGGSKLGQGTRTGLGVRTAPEDPCAMPARQHGQVCGCAPLLEGKLQAEKGQGQAGRQPRRAWTARLFGQTLFANTSPSLFKDRGEEGDKGNQNLRQI